MSKSFALEKLRIKIGIFRGRVKFGEVEDIDGYRVNNSERFSAMKC
jgi:hypothetical protein